MLVANKMWTEEPPITQIDDDDLDFDVKGVFDEFCVDDDESDSRNTDDTSDEFSEDILSKTMEELSFREREESVHDVYGLRETIKETPDFIEDHLSKLNIAIAAIPKKASYEMAYRQSPKYVQDRRLMFLRAERFDVREAAIRMVGFFEKKGELFGTEKLTKDIHLDDLDEDDTNILKSGCVQILPSRDRGGRVMLLFAVMMGGEILPLSCARCVFYVTMAAIKDEDAQKKGICIVCSLLGVVSLQSFKLISTINSLKNMLPDRNESIHFCCENGIVHPSLQLALFVAPKHIRARSRIHYGTLTELNYSLSTYGIPTLPLKEDGTCSVEVHRAWLQRQRTQEVPCEEILVPQRFDVLFGRGKNAKGHPGNLRAGYFVDMYRKEYEAAGKFAKTRIATKIVNLVHESNGRFLKRENGAWVEVDSDVARDKVSHFFRNLRKRGDEKKRDTIPKRKPKDSDSSNETQNVLEKVSSSKTTAVVASSEKEELVLSSQKRARV